MGGAFGVDLQHTRTVIALAEGTHVRSVGDGRRHLVPNACGPDGLWGSPAAERQLRDLDGAGNRAGNDGTGLAGHLLDWRCDPLDTAFLRGLRHRLDTFVGRTARSGARDEICVVATDDGWASERCADAGLPGVTVVAPTDALVCRWLSVPRTTDPGEGSIVAVACGETWTDVAHYEVTRDRGSTQVTVAPGAGRSADGFGLLSTVLAERVLQRATEGVGAATLLTVLDGTWEYGAELGDAGPDDEVVWDKSLAGRMFDPLRLSRGHVAGWAAARSARSAVTALVDAVATTGPLVLVGGIGATWPLAGDAVRGVGEVWQSTTPAHDLAIGAARWPQLRGLFTGPVPRPRPAPAATPVRIPQPTASTADHRDPLDHLPPWERDL